MKIYQVHEIGGSYRDRHDYLLATYLDKARAEKHMRKVMDDYGKTIREDDVTFYIAEIDVVI